MAAAGGVVDAEMENWVDGLRAHVTALNDTKETTDEVVESIVSLLSKWTGAKFNVQEFSSAFRKLTVEQRANKAIMGEVLREYETARLKIGPFNDELERLWQAEQDATAEAKALIEATKQLVKAEREAEAAAKELAREQDAVTKAADAAEAAFGRQRDALLGLPTRKATADFELLLAVWESFDGTVPDEVTWHAIRRKLLNGSG